MVKVKDSGGGELQSEREAQKRFDDLIDHDESEKKRRLPMLKMAGLFFTVIVVGAIVAGLLVGLDAGVTDDNDDNGPAAAPTSTCLCFAADGALGTQAPTASLTPTPAPTPLGTKAPSDAPMPGPTPGPSLDATPEPSVSPRPTSATPTIVYWDCSTVRGVREAV